MSFPHSNLPSPSPTSETFNHRDLPRPTSRLTALDSLYSQSPSLSSSSISSSSASSVDEPPSRPLTPGIYVPTLTFFDPQTEDLDLPTIASHAVRLASARISGLTTLGSTGEAVHLTHSERALVTRTTRRALDTAGHHTLPLIVGCGAQSTRETIALCHEAQHAGGDYALILPPSYYKASLGSADVVGFFTDVADASPLPVLVYNYPAATSGTDLDSDALAALAAHPNIAGCKLTCGNTGKLARLAAATDAATPALPGSGFLCLGGSADFTLQTLVAGGSGVMCGLGNVAPRACVRVVELWAEGRVKEAQVLQAVVARGDWAAIRGGVVGCKCALECFWGYGGGGRRPLPGVSGEERVEWERAFGEVVGVERGLGGREEKVG